MSYKVTSSEKLRKSCADNETKALLYLMNFRNDSNQIYYFVIDFFNDLTGMDRYSTKLWDLQAKSSKHISAKKLGRELVTLFKNYISEINFRKYILFVGGVSDNLRKDKTKNSFSIENINEKSLNSLKVGLKDEAFKKEYINKEKITDDNINNFLTKVQFVIDDKLPLEYVKEIVKDHPKIITDTTILYAIFNEIQKIQSSKKNILAEGITIQEASDALRYFKHLTTNEIRLLTLQRLICSNPLDKRIPRSFVPIYDECPFEQQNDFIEHCRISLCRALFNKNAADSFWSIFENIYNTIYENPEDDVLSIFKKLDKNIYSNSPDFDTQSLQYFISVIKDGIQK